MTDRNQRLATVITIGSTIQKSVGKNIHFITSGLKEVGDEVKTLEKRQRELAKQRRVLEKEGRSVDALDREYEGLGRTLDDLRRKQERYERAAMAANRVGQRFSEMAGGFRRVAAAATVATAGVGYFFKSQFVDTAAEFERFQTILETTEGSQEAARKAMLWVSDFAARTPYELATVTDAFVKLRAYGLDPTSGLLKTLGDTSAAMGKDIMQAVEAIADAVTGENERLKEFGIKASKSGGKIAYEYTDSMGRTMVKTVDAANRAMIQSTLEAIFNEKYAGSMDRLSKTWSGMISNVGDQWTRFTNLVMESGPFDLMKESLGQFLDQINTMADDGRLQAWAETTGEAIVAFGRGLIEVGSTVKDTVAYVADLAGGYENLGKVLAAMIGARVLMSVGALVFEVGRLGAALIGLVGASGAAGVVGKIGPAFGRMATDVGGAMTRASAAVSTHVGKMTADLARLRGKAGLGMLGGLLLGLKIPDTPEGIGNFARSGGENLDKGLRATPGIGHAMRGYEWLRDKAHGPSQGPAGGRPREDRGGYGRGPSDGRGGARLYPQSAPGPALNAPVTQHITINAQGMSAEQLIDEIDRRRRSAQSAALYDLPSGFGQYGGDHG